MATFSSQPLPSSFGNVLFDPMKVDAAVAHLQLNKLQMADLQSQIEERTGQAGRWSDYLNAGDAGGQGVAATPSAPVGTFEQQLGGAEGGDNPAAVNKGGYSGQFQFGAARLADLGFYKPAEGENLKANEWKGTFAIPGFGATTHDDFLKSPAAQHAVFAQHVADIDKTIATTPGAAQLDQNGLRAVAHLGGNAGMQRFVESGGLYDPADSNGTRLSDYYQKFAQGGAPALQAAFGSPHGPGGPQQADAGPQMPGGAATTPGPYQVASVGPTVPPPPSAPGGGAAASAPPAAPTAPVPQAITPAVPPPTPPPPIVAGGLTAEQRRLALTMKGTPQDRAQVEQWKAQNTQAAAAYQNERQQNEQTIHTRERETKADTRQATGDVAAAAQQTLDNQYKAATEARAARTEQRTIEKARVEAGTFTQDQARAATYADRMSASHGIMNNLDAAATSFAESKKAKIGDFVGYNINSPDYQRVKQAQEDFANATLRLESGAVINPDEFTKAAKQYFPQPGDSAAVIEQKRSNREREIGGFMREAGGLIGHLAARRMLRSST